MDPFASTTDGKLIISGGNLFVNSKGDGLDSNGSIEMTGGTVEVSGPTDNGNGPLDYNGTFNISGGSLLVYGSNGMWQNTSTSSSQYAVVFSASGSENDTIELKDESGNTIFSTTAKKAYQQILFSSSDIKNGKTYTLYINGTEKGSQTISSIVTSNASSRMSEGMMQGGGNNGGMQGGRR